MIYISNNDLLKVIRQSELDVVTGQDSNLLDIIEADVITEVKQYLNVRFDADTIFSEAKRPQLALIVADLMLYHLHSRIAPDNIPTLRVDRYTNAKDWLEKVADGFINPDYPQKETKGSPLRYGSRTAKTNHDY